MSPNTLTIARVNAPDVECAVPLSIIRNKFQFNYCATCHSVQGSTIKESVTICDWKFYFTSREWVYTAITRADNWNNVYFYDYEEPEFNENLIKTYFNKKILGYRSQDKEAGRTLSNNYITVDWLMSCEKQLCTYCSRPFHVNFDNGNITTNITADRICNDIDHCLDNIVPCCVFCNSAKSNTHKLN